MERLDKCLLGHAVSVGTKEGGPGIGDVYKLRNLSDTHYYLKVEHDFTAAEVTALMKFADPLEVAQMCWEERDPEAAFSICDLLDKINAYEVYPLLDPAEHTQGKDQMIETVKAVLDQNMSEYQASLLRLDKPELIAKSAEIAAMQEAYNYMKNDYVFQKGDAEVLLRMENPLRFVADQWPDDIGGLFDMDGHIGEAIEDAAKAAIPQRGESSQEKPSIREQLREAARDTGQRQPPEAKPRGGDAR